MKDLIVKIVLSAALTASIINVPLVIYDQFHTPNKIVQEHKIELGWPPLILIVAYWLTGGGGTGKSPVPKPEKPVESDGDDPS